MADVDAKHVITKQRSARQQAAQRAPVLHVQQPPPTRLPPVLSRDDLACVRVTASSEARQH
eukprot:7016585-Pyramimonas_sp.AAC.1